MCVCVYLVELPVGAQHKGEDVKHLDPNPSPALIPPDRQRQTDRQTQGRDKRNITARIRLEMR